LGRQTGKLRCRTHEFGPKPAALRPCSAATSMLAVYGSQGPAATCSETPRGTTHQPATPRPVGPSAASGGQGWGAPGQCSMCVCVGAGDGLLELTHASHPSRPPAVRAGRRLLARQSPMQHNDGCGGPGAMAGVGGTRPQPAQPGGCPFPRFYEFSSSFTHFARAVACQHCQPLAPCAGVCVAILGASRLRGRLKTPDCL
jgi:hypothetical protein